MRSDETLREYTNCYFENRSTLAGVKDEDVIAYYKKGITNIKLFEKIHEADAHPSATSWPTLINRSTLKIL
jgi:hypothetical protein